VPDRHDPSMSTPLTAGTPLTVGNTRVKEARKLSRRSERTGRRLNLRATLTRVLPAVRGVLMLGS